MSSAAADKPKEKRGRDIRCPFCLQEMNTTHHSRSSEQLRCPKCDNAFKVREALGPRRALDDHSDDTVPVPSVWGDWGLLYFGGGLAAAVTGFSWAATHLKGKQFLVAFGVAWLVLWITQLIIRKNVEDVWWVTGLCLFAWEATGVVRYIWGTSQGMKRWTYMTIMMVVGGIIFLLQSKKEGDGIGFFGVCAEASCGGSSGYSSWSSCGSSCSSCSSCGSSCGGGCGGGCGGCG